MSCVLCLQTSTNASETIQIQSVEGQKLDLQCIIEQHFSWLKLDILNNEEDNGICCSCWQALSAFHEFYLRVEFAHKFLECDTKPVEACLFVESQLVVTPAEIECDEKEDVLGIKEIKVEPDLIADSILKPKRRRGRPRKTEVVENMTKSLRGLIAGISKDESKVESSITVIKRETIDEDTKLEALSAILNSQTDSKEMENEVIRRFRSDEEDDSSSEGEGEGEDTASLKRLKRRRKLASKIAIKSTQKTSVTKECDEYIAKHFKLVCYLCNVPLENFTELKRHFRIQHQVRGYVKCCGKKLLKRGVLVDHLRTHENPSYFKCPRCDKVLASRNSLDLHMNLHAESRERKYECGVCSKKFFTLPIYERHVLIHVPEEERTLPCPECGKTYATEQLRSEHLKTVHLKTYSKMCDICGKSVVGRAALRRHIEEHSGVPRPIIQCDLCGATLASKRGLKRHMKSLHIDRDRSKTYICPICSKVSPSEEAQKSHMKYVHAEPKHPCHMCGKIFKRPKSLKEHMTTHTGEVLYTCTYCPKTFNSNANMYSHIKKCHPVEWQQRQLLRSKNKLQPQSAATLSDDNILTLSNVLELIPQTT